MLRASCASQPMTGTPWIWFIDLKRMKTMKPREILCSVPNTQNVADFNGFSGDILDTCIFESNE